MYPSNTGSGFSSHQGVVLLFEAEHGSLQCIADAHAVTAIRTAAASAVATDLLARGVDFGRVSLVVQMQAPRDVATYLHRVGRTGRFGTVGLSVLLVADHEAAPALALLRGAGVEPRPLPRALDERDYLQRIESG